MGGRLAGVEALVVACIEAFRAERRGRCPPGQARPEVEAHRRYKNVRQRSSAGHFALVRVSCT